MAKKTSTWGFSLTDLEPTIRPQDDFSGHVHHRWTKAHPIPENESCWGTFRKLGVDVEKQVKVLVEETQTKRTLSPEEKLIRDLYRSGMDQKKRTALGISPLSKEMKRIDSIESTEALLSTIAHFHRIGVNAIWNVGVDQDMKNVNAYALYMGQSGLGMPEREYYLKDDAESKRVRTAYEAYVEKMFRLMGYTLSESGRARDTVLAVETELAKVWMSKEDRRDPEKIYNKLSLSALKKLAPGIDWKEYLKLIGAEKASYYLVMQPVFFTGAGKLFTDISLSEWRTYLRFHLVNSYAGSLSGVFERHSFSFYGTVLTGVQTMKPLWRRVISVVNGSLGEALGKEYVKRHFPPEAKKKMDLLVNDLFTAYEARIQSLDWMSKTTKKKALQKLGSFTRKIGYPKRWRSYKGLVIKADEYAGNLMRVHEYEHARYLKRLGTPVDREEWLMYPQTVNAYYQPTMNDIVFPAAILQPPFFSLSNDDAFNYGAIGTVIGHEITHGFDDEGSKFDAKGNLKSWWTPEDRKRFMAKAKKIEKQYGQYEVADGVKVNGKLTLGENIADLGGISIAYDAYKLQLARTGRKDINGLSPEKRFLIGYALVWREHMRPESEKTRVLTDPHSPSKFRINGPLSNFSTFYEAFEVRKGDKLYRAPKDREMVW